MKIPIKKGKPLHIWTEPWGDVWADRLWPDFASAAYDVWVPNVNFYEKGNKYYLRIEVPGLDKDKLAVYLDSDNNVLTIRGTRICKEEEEAEMCYLREASFGPFSRRLHLPFDVQTDNINANYKDGVLTLEILKTEEPKAKKIEIQG